MIIKCFVLHQIPKKVQFLELCQTHWPTIELEPVRFRFQMVQLKLCILCNCLAIQNWRSHQGSCSPRSAETRLPIAGLLHRHWSVQMLPCFFFFFNLMFSTHCAPEYKSCCHVAKGMNLANFWFFLQEPLWMFPKISSNLFILFPFCRYVIYVIYVALSLSWWEMFFVWGCNLFFLADSPGKVRSRNWKV